MLWGITCFAVFGFCGKPFLKGIVFVSVSSLSTYRSLGGRALSFAQCSDEQTTVPSFYKRIRGKQNTT